MTGSAIVTAVVPISTVATALFAGFTIGGVAFRVGRWVIRILGAFIATVYRVIAFARATLAAIAFTSVIARRAFLTGVVTVHALV